MYSALSLSYINVNLPKRNTSIIRYYSNFRLKNKSSHECPLPLTEKVLNTQPLYNVSSQTYRMVHNGSDKRCRTTSKFLTIRRIWKSLFGKYLLTTNIVGSGVLMVFGDVMAQEIEYRRGAPNATRYDWPRIGRMFIVGALQGPLHHYAYNWMDKVMPIANFKNVMKKILIDELVMSPACIFIFFYSACFLERKSFKETNDELKDKFLFIYFIDWLLWPGAQYINFRYLDTKYRVTFVNVCTALYNIFMSYVKHDYNAKL